MKFLTLLFCSIFILTGCSKDEEGDDQDINAEAENISGTTDAPLVLENLFENPEVVDYYVDGNWTINAAVTIEPGVRIVMKSGYRVIINSEGSLNAEGTASNQIYIVGEQDVEGYWEYFRFNGSNNPNNAFTHTIIRNGGGSSSRNGAVYLDGNARLKMQNSTVSTSLGFGLYLNNDGNRLIDFENNIFTECGQHPIRLASLAQTDALDESTTFSSGNTYNSILIDNSNIDAPFTVKKVSGDYKLTGSNNLNTDVTIEAGTSILMGPGSRVIVNSNGSLNAIGNAGNRITITGEQETKGFWEYIRFNDSNNPNNEFQYVDVSYGGGSSSREAAIYLNGNSQFTLGNSSVNYSMTNGVYVSSSSTFIDDGGNTFDDNTQDDVFQD